MYLQIQLSKTLKWLILLLTINDQLIRRDGPSPQDQSELGSLANAETECIVTPVILCTKGRTKIGCMDKVRVALQ